MRHGPVITFEDITDIALEERGRPGCDRALLQEAAQAQTVVYRVQPGTGIPTHLHTQVYDLFVGVKGELEIRYEGQQGNGLFVLKPGGFCSMPPGARHEVSNPSTTEEAFFLLIHAAHEGFDYVPMAFRATEAALPFSPR
jgi:quercetin dioxygenase-like cupin family protein